jgi:hypothetical protein
MANEVYANGMEIACKAASGKTAAAMPDTCLSPPSPPAGPVPVPYPNTAYASDATNGSTTVMISGQEVMLKDQSTFKKSTGDEAATKSLGMGVVTHALQGEASFISWSMDVKIEGANVDRHLDQMLHNEQCAPANTPPWLYTDKMDMDTAGPCKSTAKNVETKCTSTTYKNDTSGACCDAKKCMLAPYGSQPECCGDKTKHHAVPDHCFKGPGEEGYYQGIKGMSYGKGLCICVCGDDKNEKRKQHARIHRAFDKVEDDSYPSWTFGTAKKQAAKACSKVTGCKQSCMEQQLSQHYGPKGVNDNTVLRADSGGNRAPPDPTGMGTVMTPGTTFP